MSEDLLVIGYGNTLRGDDGIGPAVADEIAALELPGVRVLVVHQLTPELAADLAEVRFAVFVDAAAGGEGVAVIPLSAVSPPAVMTHAADPRALLALCAALYGRPPAAWLVTAVGADFDFREGLSPTGRRNAANAFRAVERLLRQATGS